MLRFDGALLDKHLDPFPECALANAWIRRAAKGLELSEGSPAGLIDLFKSLQRAATPTKRLPCFLDLILSLAEVGGWKTICGDFQGLIVQASTEQRIGFALRYLREHFCEEVAQVEVARRVGMSAPAFSRLFQRITGQTFQEMLLGLRVDHACRLLSATSLSITEVCFASGFRNLSNFNKQFLTSKSLSPRAYRKLQSTGDRITI